MCLFFERLPEMSLMRSSHFPVIHVLLLFAVVLLAACARAPVQRSIELPPPQTAPVPPLPRPPVPRQDMTHTVGPGETVWRIGKMYDVPAKEIMRRNRINDPRELAKGKKLVVPLAAAPVPIVTLYPSKKWKYIIIHHSATDEGDALVFDSSHRLRGFSQGLGYHFVIDNGSFDRHDGQIEMSPRWLKQQNGAHCRANRMNYRGIGVCVVGNFNKECVSEAQLDALVYLVNKLRRYYDIPLSRVIGHGQVKGARTDCPGKRFPWREFRRRLRTAGPAS
ncbi:MAG: LysM peptidoglycan-binding domain-containing protein [Candidatus Omnitrophica bacterium]|nr:LysM peptidoglycan-binding domain-containing protein [Candidatus Omnitrophota bacterium]